MRPIRIFVASPGDVGTERTSLARVVEDINLTMASLAPEKGVQLELLRWETHVHPALGEEPQLVIDKQIGAYDILIGIIWKRFGTPTTDASSGTEHEFRFAYSTWQRVRRPEIMFYFCQEPFPPPSLEDLKQYEKVAEFRDELSRKGLLWEYPTHDSFADTVKKHILTKLRQVLPQTTEDTRQTLRLESPRNELADVSEEADKLAEEFEYVRFRNPWSDERTRKLEAIYTQMRSRAPFFSDLLPDLLKSSSPGRRLLSVAIVETSPNADHLSWLAERLNPADGGDTPFIRYHAAVALLIAVRTLNRSFCPLMKLAVHTAKDYVMRDNDDPDGGRRRVIADAQAELKGKCER
jgi:Domain of unknown function (DUF4062)